MFDEDEDCYYGCPGLCCDRCVAAGVCAVYDRPFDADELGVDPEQDFE